MNLSFPVSTVNEERTYWIDIHFEPPQKRNLNHPANSKLKVSSFSLIYVQATLVIRGFDYSRILFCYQIWFSQVFHSTFCGFVLKMSHFFKQSKFESLENFKEELLHKYFIITSSDRKKLAQNKNFC